MNYTVTLTQTEDKALSYAAVSQDVWIQNAIHSRCDAAIDDIVKIAVAKCLDASMQIPGTKDEIVELAFTQGWVKTAAEVAADIEAAQAAQLAAYEATLPAAE